MTPVVERTPVHLIATGRSERTMCGIKLSTKESLPHMLLRWYPMHRLGWNPPLCARCQCEMTYRTRP